MKMSEWATGELGDWLLDVPLLQLYLNGCPKCDAPLGRGKGKKNPNLPLHLLQFFISLQFVFGHCVPWFCFRILFAGGLAPNGTVH